MIPIYVDIKPRKNKLPYVNGFTKKLYRKHTANPQVDLVDTTHLYAVFGNDFELVYKPISKIPKRNKFTKKAPKFYYPIPLSLWSIETVFDQVEIEPEIIEQIKKGNCKILLLCPFEGWTWTWWDSLLDILKSKYDLKEKHVVFLSGNYNPHPTVKTVTFNTWERQIYGNYNGDTHYNTFMNAVERPRTHKFICLNRRPSIHRYATVTSLFDVKKQGILTCAKSAGYGKDYTDWVEDCFYQDYPDLKEKYINEVKPLIPLTYNDGINPEVQNPASNEWGKIRKYYDSYLYIVTETFFENKAQGQDTLFLSEKMFKPIVFMQPFVAIARPGTVKLLKELGYKTFGDYIDESYDDVLDDKTRLKMAITSINTFISRTHEELNKLMIEMKPIFEHNYRLLKERHDVTIYKNLKEDLMNALME